MSASTLRSRARPSVQAERPTPPTVTPTSTSSALTPGMNCQRPMGSALVSFVSLLRGASWEALRSFLPDGVLSNCRLPKQPRLLSPARP